MKNGKENSFGEMPVEIVFDALEKVSGGTEVVEEEFGPSVKSGQRGVREDADGADSGSGLIGAGAMDRTALSIDRFRELLTGTATGKQ